MKKTMVLKSVSQALRRLCGGAMLLLFLCVLPLVFHDAFFDINRFKLSVFLPSCAVLGGLGFIAQCLPGKDKKRVRRVMPVCVCAGLFMLACAVSCQMYGFPGSMLDGSDGRFCGLWFMLACSAGLMVIAAQLRAKDVWLVPVLAAGTLSGVLGILNAVRIDPLGFYDRLSQSQMGLFLSTVGNVDFFGVYMVMLLGLAAGVFVYSEHIAARLMLMLVAVFSLGTAVSGSDVALGGGLTALLVLTMLAGDDLKKMGRAVLALGVYFAAYPAAGLLLAEIEDPTVGSGVTGVLCRGTWSPVLPVLFLIAAAVLFALNGRVPEPGRKRTLFFGLAIVGLCAAALLAVILCHTLTRTRPGVFPTLLRFGDRWGSRRGFVWIRSFRALKNYSPTEWLFGRGLEQTRAILTPYFDKESMLSYGIFNDAHCQPLQLLLTGGLFASGSFIALQVSVLRTTCRQLCSGAAHGLAAVLWAYVPMSLLTVTQPIVLILWFGLAAFAAAYSAERQETEELR